MNQIQIIGMTLLVLFYGSYFVKLFSLQRKGIKTDRLGKGRKDFSTAHAERTLKRSTIAIAVIQICSIFINDPDMIISSSLVVRRIGLGLAIMSIAIFIAAIVTMGNNWRAGIDRDQQTTLITSGIYKFSRNPAFLGFDLLYIGIAMAFSNWILLIVSCMGMTLMHFQILEEERYLSDIFREAYVSYKKQTPRYFLFF